MPKRVGSASPTAFALLADFLDCRVRLRRLVAKIVKPQDIDDILQETFIRACAASEKTEVRHPRSFILKTAQNLALNHVMSAYSRRTQLEDFSTSDVFPAMESVGSEVESQERFLGFCRAVRDLPPQCRRVFVLRKVYGLSMREIASYLGISESTAEKHAAKGLLLCSKALRAMGHLNDKKSAASSGKRSAHG